MSTAHGGTAIVEIADVTASVDRARHYCGKFFDEIVWQVEHRAWEVLGYATWDDMREAEYGDLGVVVPRVDRPELVARLRATGMPNATIGRTLGVGEATVRRDVNRQMANDDQPATIVNARGQARPATYRKSEPDPEPESGNVIALHGATATHTTRRTPAEMVDHLGTILRTWASLLGAVDAEDVHLTDTETVAFLGHLADFTREVERIAEHVQREMGQ